MRRYYCEPCRLVSLRATKRRTQGLPSESQPACEFCRAQRRKAFAALSPERRRTHRLNREPDLQCVADILAVALGDMDPGWIKAGGRAEVVKILLADGGRTYREIATQAGTSEQTVQRRAKAAREGREYPMPSAFCQPCRDRRTQRSRGLVETAPLCEDCRRKRREKAAAGPKRVRVYDPRQRSGKGRGRFHADQLAIDLVADGVIEGSRVRQIERREAAKILLLRGRLDHGAIALRCGLHIRSVSRLAEMMREGSLELRVN